MRRNSCQCAKHPRVGFPTECAWNKSLKWSDGVPEIRLNVPSRTAIVQVEGCGWWVVGGGRIEDRGFHVTRHPSPVTGLTDLGRVPGTPMWADPRIGRR